MNAYNRVHADVDLNAFEHNLDEIKRQIRSETRVIAVIKTDAYGHGASILSGILEEREEVFGYAVASVDEGRVLRQAGRKKPILILGYTFPDQYDELIDLELTPTIFSYNTAWTLAQTATMKGREVKVHIKLDTGMSRIGYQITEKAADEIASISKLKGLSIEGIFTHFARADEKDKHPTHEQAEAFETMLDMLAERGVDIPYRHMANSAAILELPKYQKELVRAGIILYGLWPSADVDHTKADLWPVMSITSRIIHIKELGEGRSISYGGTYQLTHPERIATVPVGYGDGYPRSLSNCGYVLIHGKKAPIRGRVCMDQFMVDVSEIPDVRIGDPVVLLGKDRDEIITMEQLGVV